VGPELDPLLKLDPCVIPDGARVVCANRLFGLGDAFGDVCIPWV
jgi:hypothetical protein